MAEYNIAVTGLNAADMPASGISVIRCIKQAFGNNVRIIGFAYELLCSTSYVCSLVDEVYYVPFPQEDEDRYLSRIAEIIKKTKIDCLIPNLDFEIPIVSKLEPDLRDLGLRLLVPQETSLALCKKEELLRLAQQVGIDYPYSRVFDDRRLIATTASYFAYPLTIKAAKGEAVVVYSLEEAIVFSNRLSSQWGWPLIMQGYIKGDEYCIAAVADRKQKIYGTVCMKKILKSRSGTAWMGVTTKDEELMEVTRKVIDKTKWVGPMEIEVIKEQSSGQYFLIEINPRFPAWIELSAQAECNLPMVAVKLAMRQKVDPLLVYKSGVLFARSAMDITCSIDCLGQLSTKKELIHHEDKR